MPDIHLFEPLWGEWYIVKKLGQGSFGTVYLAEKSELGKKYYSAIKHIKIPVYDHSSDDLYSETDATRRQYYDGILKTLMQEIEINYQLKGNTNIVSYEEHKVFPRENEPGYDILIKMELLTSLTDHIKNDPMTVGDVVRLGVDVCTALTVLQQEQIVHRDIKPTNIFVNSSGHYKLGDFGVARILKKTASSMSVKGTIAYMSPEVRQGGEGDYRVDVYSLGLVLYRLLNVNRAPFLPMPPASIDFNSTMQSNRRRLQGEKLPPPVMADERLSAIILKACAYRPEDRYLDAIQFRSALAEYEATASSERLGFVVVGTKPVSSRMESPNESLPNPEPSELPKSEADKQSSAVFSLEEKTQFLTQNTENRTCIIQKVITQMRIREVITNLVKWGLQTVLLSLLPLIFYILVHWMFQLEEDPMRRYISELCSFTLVISSSVAMELFKKNSPNSVRAILFPAYFALLAIFLVTYGIIYCCLELGLQLSPVIFNNMFLTIKIISAIHFVTAFLLQILEVFYGE